MSTVTEIIRANFCNEENSSDSNFVNAVDSLVKSGLSRSQAFDEVEAGFLFWARNADRPVVIISCEPRGKIFAATVQGRTKRFRYEANARKYVETQVQSYRETSLVFRAGRPLPS